MDTATRETGILWDFKDGYNGMGNIQLALRKFRYDRPDAEATEIHVHRQTVKAQGIDPATVKKQTGLRLVTNDPDVKENRVRVIGLEATL